MTARKPDPLDGVSRRVSDLYVTLEDFRDEASDGNRRKILALFQGLRAAMDTAEEHLCGRNGVMDAPEGSMVVSGEMVPPPYTGPLIVRDIYTRKDLRELFEITDATLNNGVFDIKDRPEIWLFVTENKSADREQYVDKLTGDILYWQGQRLGRTDPLIINHRRNGDLLLVFYRRAKYQFEGAGFVFEGPFEYVSHSGGLPTSFILRRRVAHLR
jgi:hypothetical protein